MRFEPELESRLNFEYAEDIRASADTGLSTIGLRSIWALINQHTIAKAYDGVPTIALAVPALLAAGAAVYAFGSALTTLATIVNPVFTAVSVGIAGITAATIGATAALSVLSVTLMLTASAVQTMAAISRKV